MGRASPRTDGFIKLAVCVSLCVIMCVCALCMCVRTLCVWLCIVYVSVSVCMWWALGEGCWRDVSSVGNRNCCLFQHLCWAVGGSDTLFWPLQTRTHTEQWLEVLLCRLATTVIYRTQLETLARVVMWSPVTDGRGSHLVGKVVTSIILTLFPFIC